MTARRLLPLLAILAAVCLAGILALDYFRSRALGTTEGMIRRLPSAGATVLHIDVAALRRSGLLEKIAGSRIAEEPDYRAFVKSTGFDYREDLDTISAALVPDASYFLVRGRFDWDALAAHARREGGQCFGKRCEMAGTQPGRRISFLPLRDDLMALAVSGRAGAASDLRRPPASSRQIIAPHDAVWISLPKRAFSTSEELPVGARFIARAMSGADQATLSFAPAEQGAVEAKLVVQCRSHDDARALSEHLSKTTKLLRDMIARESQQPNPSDLSGVLTSGSFQQEGHRVRGRWLLEPAFLESMLSGAAGH